LAQGRLLGLGIEFGCQFGDQARRFQQFFGRLPGSGHRMSEAARNTF